jgi:cytochrome c6
MRQKKIAAAIVLLLALSLSVLSTATGQTKKDGAKKKAPAGAAGLGAKVFDRECATCHEGGNNSIEASKTLKLADLKANGFESPADIQKRVREGKAIMPAFETMLKPAEIEAVAAYVWGKAQKDWK